MQTFDVPKRFTPATVAARMRGDAEHVSSAKGLMRSKILIVDDEELNIQVVSAYLKVAGYNDVTYTTDPLCVLSLMAAAQPDLVLLDIHMPQINGLDVLRQIRAIDALTHLPVVVLTSATGDEVRMEALETGATDFLNKPVNCCELSARVRNILMAKGYQDTLRNQSTALESAVRQRTLELEASRRALVGCLARAAEYRDDNTGHHILRVGRYARLIGEELGLTPSTLADLEDAAKLHDLGKIGVPDAILKKPAPLTDDEYAEIQKHCNFGKKIIGPLSVAEWQTLRQHVLYGGQILEAAESPMLVMAKRIALTHHERWDGTGYPLGLLGEDIPVEGRIVAVADVFDALSSRRPYKPPFPINKCFEILQDGRGTHFDPRVLDAFLTRREDVVRIQIEYANEE